MSWRAMRADVPDPKDRAGGKPPATRRPRTPWFARALLRVFLSRRRREFIIGDLEELFVWWCGAGVGRARWRYMGAALGRSSRVWRPGAGREEGRREPRTADVEAACSAGWERTHGTRGAGS